MPLLRVRIDGEAPTGTRAAIRKKEREERAGVRASALFDGNTDGNVFTLKKRG